MKKKSNDDFEREGSNAGQAMQLYTSNCIYGASNICGLFEYCHLAESILFPISLDPKARLNKYKSRHNFKMKTPEKNLHIGS